ncbi:hypothetical protein EK21DRAFT_116813 [Setomelanomma holmii]|uniref:Uncharacterized protein n=1 Tax=Setomelanomma holmii TaxID=210430 RepID=A0A9P4LHP1_9PLEO|nr:hypothetical protein EK21DRAFT_116813 [Setomelanomma holmii]
MATNGTDAGLVTSSNSSWSKEAIIGLATIFIMILLSGLRVICKHWSKGASSIRFQTRWFNDNRNDTELVPLQRAYSNTGWIDIVDVRRYQQENYTSISPYVTFN